LFANKCYTSYGSTGQTWENRNVKRDCNVIARGGIILDSGIQLVCRLARSVRGLLACMVVVYML